MKRTLKDFGALTPAEQTLRDEVGNGLTVIIGDGTLPKANAGPERQVHASFIRYLALGGCDKCRPSENGVRLSGAVIVGDGHAEAEERGGTRGLDLEGCKIDGDLALFNCHFSDPPLLRGTRLGSLFLNGACFERGIRADRLSANGSAFLRGVAAKGEVRLLGASLGADLDCSGAVFEAVADGRERMGHAFAADSLTAKGSALLRHVTAKGEVRLLGASLGGAIDCEGAVFEAVADGQGRVGRAFAADRLTSGNASFRGITAKGEVRLLGASLGGDLDCSGADLAEADLNLQSARIGSGFLYRQLRSPARIVILTDAEAASLVDSPDAWPEKGSLDLERFRYGAILGAPVDVVSRLDWLARSNDNPEQGEFSPQPYEQLAKVLRGMGHPRDARMVLERKERYQRAAGAGQLPSGSLRRPLRRAWSWILRWTVGFGHYPIYTVGWLLGLWLLGAVVYSDAYITGDFKPNNAFVLRADEWVACADAGAFPDQLRCFEAQPEAASYPAFNPWTYSLDVLLPVVSLEMQQYWTPDSAKSTRGVLTRWFLWLQILAGWALTLLAVAGFSGIVKSDR